MYLQNMSKLFYNGNSLAAGAENKAPKVSDKKQSTALEASGCYAPPDFILSLSSR